MTEEASFGPGQYNLCILLKEKQKTNDVLCSPPVTRRNDIHSKHWVFILTVKRRNKLWACERSEYAKFLPYRAFSWKTCFIHQRLYTKFGTKNYSIAGEIFYSPVLYSSVLRIFGGSSWERAGETWHTQVARREISNECGGPSSKCPHQLFLSARRCLHVRRLAPHLNGSQMYSDFGNLTIPRSIVMLKKCTVVCVILELSVQEVYMCRVDICSPRET